MQLLTYGETLLDKINSVSTCVTYGRTPNRQNCCGGSGTINYGGKTTNIALTYG